MTKHTNKNDVFIVNAINEHKHFTLQKTYI